MKEEPEKLIVLSYSELSSIWTNLLLNVMKGKIGVIPMRIIRQRKIVIKINWILLLTNAVLIEEIIEIVAKILGLESVTIKVDIMNVI
ncbi:hypothetical protein OC709_02515 ['Planchonia careya' phytoplasma]|nr:hypothetical protein ['Planchonia careya' phytoplasma]MDO8030364.1 hypothetical protein ['Planchonia careya' phytoplasma]